MSEAATPKKLGRPPAVGGFGGHYADELDTPELLKNYLCDLAADFNHSGKSAVKVHWRMCERCTSPCGYGRKYARIMRDRMQAKAAETRRVLWLKTALKPMGIVDRWQSPKKKSLW